MSKPSGGRCERPGSPPLLPVPEAGALPGPFLTSRQRVVATMSVAPVSQPGRRASGQLHQPDLFAGGPPRCRLVLSAGVYTPG